MDDRIPTLLREKPSAARAFERLLPVLDGLGPYRVEEKKSSLHVVAGKAAFLGVHPRKDGLRLNLVLARALDGAVKAEQVSARRFHNEIDLAGDVSVSPELEAWLKEAYARTIG